MISPAFDAAWQATWPAADYADHGGLRVGRGLGGGGRVSAARVVGDWDEADITAAEATHAGWGQPALFAVEDGDDALAAALAARGYRAANPTLILSAPLGPLTDRAIPPVTALESWPPLAIQRDLWRQLGVGDARQAVMARVAGPHTAILGRVEDRAAGAAFAAVHGGIGTLHALAVLPRWRGRGLGAWMVRRAADFAARHGATDLALAVTEANAAARALYAGLGFATVGRYAYWQRDGG